MNIETTKEGTGSNVPRGANVKVHYTGRFEDGQKFDSSQGGPPLKFQVGLGQVIRCWDEGMLKMNKGQEALLTCPPEYAYGKKGAGGVIPPNATLKFEVKIIDYN